jgi:hydroxymethylglutaryl-CoA reductase (NADPH)
LDPDEKIQFLFYVIFPSYVTIPVGVAGPVLIDGDYVAVPMATTEGCLIASTHRGCKAINESGGSITVVTDNGMTRAPLIRLPSVTQAAKLKRWLEDDNNYYLVEAAFNGTSRFARLKSVNTHFFFFWNVKCLMTDFLF